MIHRKRLYRVDCNNMGCKNGKKNGPTVYENTEEMGYRKFQETIVDLGWIFRGELTFCPECARAPSGLLIMKM